MTTATETIQKYRVYIQATPEAIWQAITRPEWTQRYGYAPLVDYDLRPGGTYLSNRSGPVRCAATSSSPGGMFVE